MDSSEEDTAGQDDTGAEDIGVEDEGDGEVSMSCGNGVIEDGEECDDGNDVSNDGCEPDCTFSCHHNVDCNDGNTCNGLETCGPETGSGRTCRAGRFAPAGTTCNDELFCTAVDECDGDGICIGSGNTCEDDLPCTDDSCDEDRNRCPHAIIEGTCLIEGYCYDHGDANDANTCLLCDGENPERWSFRPEGDVCNDGDVCSGPDRCDASGHCAGPPLPELREVVSFCGGPGHTCAALLSGAVKCWGASGQNGDPVNDRPVPGDVVGLSSGVLQVSCGEYHTCALMESGDVGCWGDGSMGQLGRGSTEPSAEAVDVVGLPASATWISCGAKVSCAVLTTGQVYCWGENWNGMLGYDTFSEDKSTTPGEVTGLTDSVTQVFVGGTHVCALVDSGQVMCWGGNFYGQLGDGTDTGGGIDPNTVIENIDGPVYLENVTEVSCGAMHSCARVETGAVKCWGYNYNGQLGYDTSPTNQSTIAREVTGIGALVLSVAAGGYHVCVRRDDNRVMCWGSNSSGQLGDGSTIQNPLPNFVGTGPTTTLSNVSILSAANQHTCACSEISHAMCWGKNEYGQIGNDDPGNNALYATGVHCN